MKKKQHEGQISRKVKNCAQNEYTLRKLPSGLAKVNNVQKIKALLEMHGIMGFQFSKRFCSNKYFFQSMKLKRLWKNLDESAQEKTAKTKGKIFGIESTYSADAG